MGITEGRARGDSPRHSERLCVLAAPSWRASRVLASHLWWKLQIADRGREETGEERIEVQMDERGMREKGQWSRETDRVSRQVRSGRKGKERKRRGESRVERIFFLENIQMSQRPWVVCYRCGGTHSQRVSARMHTHTRTHAYSICNRMQTTSHTQKQSSIKTVNEVFFFWWKLR